MQNNSAYSEIQCSGHRLVRSRISLNLKRERIILVKKKQANLDVVRAKADQFRLVLENKYAALEQEGEDYIDLMNETVTRLISEAANKVGGKAPSQPVGKLSQVTKDLIRKRQSMKLSNSRNQIGFAALSKLMNKTKVGDIQNYIVQKIEEAVKYGRSIRSVRRKLGIGQGKLYALKDKQGNIISNFGYTARAEEVFYTDLYSTQSSQATFIRSSDEQDTEVLSINSDEVRRALQDMTRGNAAGEDGIKYGGNVMHEKLAALYTQCLTTSSVPESGKNANMILSHKKG